jgi:integrase/recombinase XerD
MTLSDAFSSYCRTEITLKGGADKTRKNYITTCNSIVAALGDLPVQLLTLEHIEKWVEYMQSLGHQPSTTKTCLTHLRCVFKCLKKKEYQVIDWRDIELPKVPRKKHVVLDYSEVQEMIDAATNPRDKAIVSCLFATGCRISELLNLNRGDIQNGEAVVLGKGSKLRPVFFDKTALEALQAYLDTRHDNIPALFVSGQYRRITVCRVEQILHVLAATAGIEKNVTPHVFRHSTITDYIQNGAPMGIVQRMAGHSSIKTTMDIYTHVSDNTLRDVAKRYHSK